MVAVIAKDGFAPISTIKEISRGVGKFHTRFRNMNSMILGGPPPRHRD